MGGNEYTSFLQQGNQATAFRSGPFLASRDQDVQTPEKYLTLT